MFELERISKDAIPASLEKAMHYRLLNEPLQSESICLDILEVEPENQQALVTLLLALSEALAREHGLSAMSLIVASSNEGARRLYERIGYVETARRTIVKDGWECDSAEWVLLVKPL